MAITPYDNAAWSTYTPLTSQEILAPSMMMRERHDKLDEEYAAINDELQAIAFIAEHEDDSDIKNRYSNFMDNLEEGRDELMNKGITSSSRRNMLDLRSRFQSEIQPLKMGYELRNRDVETYNQMLASDPTYIGQNPADRKISHYIKNGLTPEPPVGISGDWVAKAATEQLAPYSKKLSHSELRKLIGSTLDDEGVNDFMEYFQEFGMKPGSPAHSLLLKAVEDNIIESVGARGARGWATDDQIERIKENVNRAASATIGADKAQIVNNPAARQRAASNASTIEEPFARSNIDLGIETTEKSDVDFENIEYSPESEEFITPEITQLREEIGELEKQEEELQRNIDNSSSKAETVSDAKKSTVNFIKEKIEEQVDNLVKIESKIESEGEDSDSLKELEAINNSIKRLEKNLEKELGYISGYSAELRQKNKIRGSIDRKEKKIKKSQEKLNNLADRYKYLNEDPLIAAKFGSAIEQSQSKRSLKVVPFSEKSPAFLKETLSNAMTSANNSGRKNYGLFKLGKGLKQSKKSISVSDIEKIRKDGNGILGTSAKGIILMNGGDQYLVKTSDSAIEAANQIYPKLNSFLENYRSDMGSKPITFNSSTQESFINGNIGETIVDLDNITIRGLNFVDGKGIFWKQIVIDTKSGYPVSFVTNANDEAGAGDLSAKIMREIDNLVIDGTLRGSARTAVKDRTLN